MRNMGKTLKRVIAAIVIVVVLAAGSALWLKSYIAPQQELDLSYEPIDLKQKLLDMISRLEPVLILSEEDINNLIKMQLSTNGIGSNPDIQVDGAKFELDDGKLIAHVNVTYKDRLPVGAEIVYRLAWQAPAIIMEPESVRIRGLRLPASLVDSQTIELPESEVVKINDIVFDRNQVKIGFSLF